MFVNVINAMLINGSLGLKGYVAEGGREGGGTNGLFDIHVCPVCHTVIQSYIEHVLS